MSVCIYIHTQIIYIYIYITLSVKLGEVGFGAHPYSLSRTGSIHVNINNLKTSCLDKHKLPLKAIRQSNLSTKLDVKLLVMMWIWSRPMIVVWSYDAPDAQASQG